MKNLLGDIGDAIFIIALVVLGLVFLFPDFLIGCCTKVIYETDYPIYIKLMAGFVLLTVVIIALWILVDIIKSNIKKDSKEKKVN